MFDCTNTMVAVSEEVGVDEPTLRPRRPAGEIARFGADGEFVLKQAMTEADRLMAWHLVYQEYLDIGYTMPHPLKYRYSIHDALPGTATFLVEWAGEAVGTVSVFPDSPLGLPADEIYKSTLDAMRASGHRMVEVGRLTVRADFKNQRDIVINLFDVLSLHSRCLEGATDLVITVNPSHVKFYERMLLFEKIGESQCLSSVCGAPAVPLRLDLERQKQAIRWEKGEGPKPVAVGGFRTFYRGFSNTDDEERRVSRLRRAQSRLGEEFIRRYFVKMRPLIPNLPRPLRYFLLMCYPGLSNECL